MHESGMLEVIDGSIVGKVSKIIIDNMGIVVDKKTGTVLKYGDLEKSDIKDYYNKMCGKYKEMGLYFYAESICLISFDEYKEELSIDEVCSLTNYFLNNIGHRIFDILSMDKRDLKKEIKKIIMFGF